MVNTIQEKIKQIYRKIALSKINYLNHKFKKYIVKFEEEKDIIKIYNSNGDYKIVDKSIANKVKIMEIIKEHKKEMDNKINYYENNSEDYKIILVSSSLLLLILGFVFVFSFFVGSYIFLILSLLAFSISLSLFGMNIYKILLFREEVKRLVLIKENKEILNDDELITIIKDSFIVIKNHFYNLLIKIFDVFESKRVKS